MALATFGFTSEMARAMTNLEKLSFPIVSQIWKTIPAKPIMWHAQLNYKNLVDKFISNDTIILRMSAL